MTTHTTAKSDSLAEFDRQIQKIAESRPAWPLWYKMRERADSERIMRSGAGARQLPETPHLSAMKREAKMSRFEREGGDSTSLPKDGFPQDAHRQRDYGGYRPAVATSGRRMLPESYDARLFEPDTLQGRETRETGR